jgi:hypothetical protein
MLPYLLEFLKLFDKIFAPLTAGLFHPYRGDKAIAKDRLQQLDRLYQSVTVALRRTARRRRAQGGRLLARYENSILVGAPITV